MYSAILVGGLLLASSAAASPQVKRADGPTDPGIASDCTFLWTSETGDNCAKLESDWAVTHSDFVEWNPAVKNDCSGFIAGHAYCVEVSSTHQKPTTTSSTPIITTPTTTGTPLPSPTQDGLTKDCTKFYKAQSGDTCDKVISKYGTFTFNDFYKWNPAVKQDCSNLQAYVYYCVGVPGTPDHPTTTTSAGPSGPSPTQDGIAKSCNQYYKAQSGDGCQVIVDKYPGITLDDFYKWNPAVGNDCSKLFKDYYYCVGVPFNFRLKTRYHNDCTGDVYKDVIIATDNDGICVNTDCQAASLEISPEGLCPGGQVQISYWEQPGCQGKWFGYGYNSRGTCHRLWDDGWKFKALHFRCAKREDDCVSQQQCTYEPEPENNTC